MPSIAVGAAFFILFSNQHIDAAGEGVEAHLVKVVQGGGEDEALGAQQHEQAQLPEAGHEGQQVAADDGRLLDGDDDAGHPLDPGDVLDVNKVTGASLDKGIGG